MKIPKGLRVCYSIAADFAARFKADMLGTYAASAAFFIFVSLFPCFLLAVAILDLCGIAGWDVLYEFLAGAPRHVIDLLTSLMNEAENSGNMRIISIATLATLWAASRGVFALMEALGRIYITRGETRPYIANRLLAILYTVAFILMMIIIIVLLIFGGKITAFLSENLPFFAELGWIVTFARYALGALLLVTFFTMLSRPQNLAAPRASRSNNRDDRLARLLGNIFSLYRFACQPHHIRQSRIYRTPAAVAVFLSLYRSYRRGDK